MLKQGNGTPEVIARDVVNATGGHIEIIGNGGGLSAALDKLLPFLNPR